jgi:glucose-6-phosphate isomerase
MCIPAGCLQADPERQTLQGEVVSNHDELMCNFFAQADALATGKTPIELRAGNVPDSLIPHKTFTGNRPSTSVLLPELTAFTVGQILSLYENRIAVQVCPPERPHSCRLHL